MRTLVALFTILLLVSNAAEAGRGGGSTSSRTSSRPSSAITRSSTPSKSSGTFSGGTTASRTLSRQDNAGARPHVSIPPATANRLFASQIIGSSAAGFRSLSAHARGRQTLAAPTKPSPQLQAIIKQHEAQRGPGWLGTAALVWLLSRHDLSAADRSWVSSQIAQGGSADENPTSVDRQAKQLTFDWQGLPSTAAIGESVTLRVRATSANGAAQALTCSSTNGSLDQTVTDTGVALTWTPARAGTAILQCDALTEGERRTVAVAL
ncbi:hypothetical protein [Burkholderia territorii]|uniref:hypothetical protein n=1 Tax=Burkholderia territorii TaxID=1503055 RepID=UPI000AB5B2DF|nr:hypothetical protein [Burkholderia territorii]